MRRYIKQGNWQGDLKRLLLLAGLIVPCVASACKNRSVEPQEVIHASAATSRVEAGGGAFSIESANVISQSKIVQVGRRPEGGGGSLQCLSDGLCWLTDSKTTWRTENSGITWERIDEEGSTFHERNVIFLSEDIGWGWNVHGVYKTENGGKRWEEQPSPTLRGRKVYVRTIRFEDAEQVGWLGGVSYQPLEKGESTTRYTRGTTENEISRPALFWTTDGGKQWNESLLSDKVGSIDKIQFFDSRHGFAMGHDCGMYSQDGGKTWLQVDTEPDCIDKKYYTPVYYEARVINFFFLDRSHGWMLYNNGRIIFSRNGGKKWCDWLPSSEGENPIRLYDIYFIDALRGWGVGAGYLFETVDGGLAWTKIEYPVRFSKLYGRASKDIWLISEEGIFKVIIQ